MYRHPYANPELLYGRAITPEYQMDKRSPSPGPYAPYRSFMPMASQANLFDTRTCYSEPPLPTQGRAMSLPDVRHTQSRYIGGHRMAWSDGMEDVQSDHARNEQGWKRILQRMKRQARYGLKKVRAILQRDPDKRRSFPGFS